MTKLRFIFLVLIIFITCTFPIKANADHGFQKNQLIYTQYICFNEKSIMQLTEADVEDKTKSVMTAKYLVQLGQCGYIPKGIRMRIIKVLLDYVDYDNNKIQVIKAEADGGGIIYTAAYRELAHNMPYAEGTKEEIKI